MGRRPKTPLRSLTHEERAYLQQLSRAHSAPSVLVKRAVILLAVADGATFVAAARKVGRRDGDSVAALVLRFNSEGLAALKPRHGGGPPVKYGAKEQQRVLAEASRQPNPAKDGTAAWSLSTLERALRRSSNGLPEISKTTIRTILRDSGFSWQKDRSWIKTGSALRKRKSGVVEVFDPDVGAKKF